MDNQSTTSSASTIPPPASISSVPSIPPMSNIDTSPPPIRADSSSVNPSNRKSPIIASSPPVSANVARNAAAKRNVAPSKTDSSRPVPSTPSKQNPMQRNTSHSKTSVCSADPSALGLKTPRRKNIDAKAKAAPIPSLTSSSQEIPANTGTAAEKISVRHGTHFGPERIGNSLNLTSIAAVLPKDGGQARTQSKNIRRAVSNEQLNSKERNVKRLQGMITKQRRHIKLLEWAMMASVSSPEADNTFPNLMKRDQTNKVASVAYMCNELRTWCEKPSNSEISTNEIIGALELRTDGEQKVKELFTFIIETSMKSEETPKKETYRSVMNALLSLISAASGDVQVRVFEMTKKFLNQMFDLCLTPTVHFLVATNLVKHFVGPLMAYAENKEWGKLYGVVGRCCIRTISNAAKKAGKATSAKKGAFRIQEVALCAASVLNKNLASQIREEHLRILASKDMIFALHMDELLERIKAE